MADLTALISEVFSKAGDDPVKKADLEAAIKASGAKFTDLSDGEYVAKEKFDKAAEKAKAAAAKVSEELKEAKDALETATKDDSDTDKRMAELEKAAEDTAKKLEASDAKALKLEREKVIAAKVTDPRFARLAYIDASAATSEDTDFETALEAVLEDNPDYLPSESDDDESEDAPPSRASTGKPVTKGKPAKSEEKALAAFKQGTGGASEGKE